MMAINFIILSLITVNFKLFLSQLAYLLVCPTSNFTMSLKKISNISHSILSDNSGLMFKSFRETFSLVTSSITTRFFRWLFLHFGFTSFLPFVFLFCFFFFLAGSSPLLLSSSSLPSSSLLFVSIDLITTSISSETSPGKPLWLNISSSILFLDSLVFYLLKCSHKMIIFLSFEKQKNVFLLLTFSTMIWNSELFIKW